MIKRKYGIITFVILAIVAIATLVLEVNLCRIRSEQKKIGYEKKADTSFVTELKDNNYYNINNLNSEYNYVASLIDAFKIDYNYAYTLSEDINYNLTYNVKAYLEVFDSNNNSKPIEKKEYILVPNTTIEGNGKLIKVDLLNERVDYQNYNKIVQNWKKEVTPEANLKVVFNVSWIGDVSTFKNQIQDTYTSTLNIPISQKTITIQKPISINEQNVLTEKDDIPLIFKIAITFTIILFISSLVRLFLYYEEINNEKDKYEQEIKKILREFDRAITEARGPFIIRKEDNNIQVNDFYELMDVHDNLNIPIIYYKNSKRESYFAVRNDSTVYYCKYKKKDKNLHEDCKESN